MTAGEVERPASGEDSFTRIVWAVVLFGSAFGFVEAAVVVDLRSIYEPYHAMLHPSSPPGELFPLLTLEDLDRGPENARFLMRTEVAREAATIVMLAGFALGVGGSPLRRFGAFVAAFGVWDLVFYLGLKILVGWPSSMFTWDVLFLIPAPWAAPVLAPALVAWMMVCCGLHTAWRDCRGRPIQPSVWDWLGVLGGGAIVLVSFLWNVRAALTGHAPSSFPWWVYAAGLATSVGIYVVTANRASESEAADVGEPGRGD